MDVTGLGSRPAKDFVSNRGVQPSSSLVMQSLQGHLKMQHAR
jgi:hypothetical protein